MEQDSIFQAYTGRFTDLIVSGKPEMPIEFMSFNRFEN